ncbi:hypothetical protein DICPUDRAFT_28946 [Dictyostelium purpureum]|uniref:Dynactin subunit 4 n=1 Tax=Dictyostelium purpureum TaxID=5786 RepID=F0ZCQ1_DICPU|nr:uncharacterized protein DICPUDRAFT_28946 [Dictyostelium purpureum]EGC38309.1 hypothetical protein DICPUDRAFT_28946 [Dictyostelium purpureum]|eukprot:XP_003285170.1 hypothetical protein DICPUDRAFT_28946 [Dictyostelium purpureum]
MYSQRLENTYQFNKNLTNHDIIKYSCNCGKSYHLTELYYCISCLKTNCKFCITEDIDCYYCPNCLEHISSAEASLNGNRCKKCFECPMCFNVLTYSASTNANGVETFFLNCTFCKWNSINSGEKEFRFDSHSIKAKNEESEAYIQLNKVLEIVNKESAELSSLKDKKTLTRIKIAQAMKQFLGQQSKHQKHSQRKNFLKSDEQRWINSSVPEPLPDNNLLPKITPGSSLLTNANIKKGLTPITTEDSDKMQQDRVQSRIFNKIESTLPTNENNTLFDDAETKDQYDDDLDLDQLNKIEDADEISTLAQRLHQIPTQSKSLKKLEPHHRPLLTRRSKRCKRCDRLLIKPDVNPGKTEFKRQHFAYSYLPRIHISKINWIDNDLFEMFLVFNNPLHSHLFMNFPMEIKGSMISLDDNAQLVDLYQNETFIGGLLDETDDMEKEAHIQQLKNLEDARYFIDRKDNRLKLRFIGKVGVENSVFDNNGQDEVTHLIIHLPDQLLLNTDENTINEKKFNSKFENIKFTICLEFSTKSLTLNNNNNSSSNIASTTPKDENDNTPLGSSGTLQPPSESASQKTLLKILFDIPSKNFTNTQL